MVNYFNFTKFSDEYLITNDFGRYQFVDGKCIKNLVLGYENAIEPITKEKLIENMFLTGVSKQAYLDRATPCMRDSKSHLFQSTGLFIFVVTNSCNLNCVYCQAQSENSKTIGMMTEEIARRGVDIAMQSPTENLTIEFQGGEPLINFRIIKYIVEYVEQINTTKRIMFNLVSNLSLLTDEMIDFIVEHKIQVSVSLDGNEDVHNNNRCFGDGSGSFKATMAGIRKFNARNIELGAIQTTTRYSLPYWKEIIDKYIELGFKSIFIRPLTQLGYANEHWSKIGYSSEEFIDFYTKAVDYIIQKNCEGISFSEGHAIILLNKIINGYSGNYMELRSPCGATLGQMAIYYDGDIYTCDEGRMLAEMGDKAFKLGNVFKNDYDELIESGICKTVCVASCLESIPGCCDCVYHPYCGVCPVINYAIEGDLFSKICYTGDRCKNYKGILDYLFTILQKNDSEVLIMRRWVE